MNIREYRVTMKHDGGTTKITTTATTPASAVDVVVEIERAPRRAARLVEVRPLQFERNGDDTWAPVSGDQWGRVDDQPANVDAHTNPFAPDPSNTYTRSSTAELETYANLHAAREAAALVSAPRTTARLPLIREELERRGDVDQAVSLWERLCAVDFVRGETQGHYTHSTAYLSPDTADHGGRVHRMPNREEIESLVLSDGEETAYPPHDTCTGSGESYWYQDTNPWSGDDRLYPITLTLISCGDYHGSDLDAANNRALDGVPGVTVREPNTGGQGSVFNVSTTMVGEMSSFENATDPGDTDREPAARRADALMWLESLVAKMEGLTDYALLDEEAHSEYIGELAEAAWSDHLESDAFDMLQEIGPGGREAWEDMVDTSTAGPELKESIRAAYFEYEENEWTAESATSVVNGRHREAVSHVARTVFGWDVS